MLFLLSNFFTHWFGGQLLIIKVISMLHSLNKKLNYHQLSNSREILNKILNHHQLRNSRETILLFSKEWVKWHPSGHVNTKIIDAKMNFPPIIVK